MTKIFLDAIANKNAGRPPVWMMRQAGRYHPHYQKIRGKYSFEEICKIPDVAAEVALVPVQDFGFDCAILFSDILFILDAMGQKLTFENGPPEFNFLLQSAGDLAKYQKFDARDYFSFQAEAVKKTREVIPENTTLLGFIGGAATLFKFASGGRNDADLFSGFLDTIFEPLLGCALLQMESGADALCIFDSSLNVDVPYSQVYEDFMKNFFVEFKKLSKKPILYYVKSITDAQIAFLNAHVDCIAVDNSLVLKSAFSKTSVAIQGNFDNTFLTLPQKECEVKMLEYFTQLKSLPAEYRNRFINSLCHGVLPNTLPENIKMFVEFNAALYG